MIEAQHTQNTASVNSGLDDNTLRITDISRGQNNRKPLKYVVEICTCCAKTPKRPENSTGIFFSVSF